MIAAIGLSALDVAVLIAYLTILAGMGVYFARRKRDSGDYFLASQKIPWWAAGLSLLELRSVRLLSWRFPPRLIKPIGFTCSATS